MNVSSVGAIMPIASPTMTSYGVAKAAQDTLTKNLAFEFATKGVRVNSVLPGESWLFTVEFVAAPEALSALSFMPHHMHLLLQRLLLHRVDLVRHCLCQMKHLHHGPHAHSYVFVQTPCRQDL